jgi:formamidopyrimidine-DNA glycosylase
MPELPDITIYVEHLSRLLVGRPLDHIRLASPFLVRTFEPPLSAAEGRTVRALHRIGKRIVWELDGEFFLVFHLMIAGRFHLKPRGAKVGGKVTLAGFDVADRTLLLTEAGTRKRASLHFVQGAAALRAFDRGGLNVLSSSPGEFEVRLRLENHTLKRALTDPRLFDGIGNSYSDEILHRAELSPLQLTKNLREEEIHRLRLAAIGALEEWTGRLRDQHRDSFPEKVTAFHVEMAVHGKFGHPCPVCGTAVQRIVYAENECNYCPRCQTGGKLLADRSLSRLLRDDWPRTIEELESGTGS